MTIRLKTGRPPVKAWKRNREQHGSAACGETAARPLKLLILFLGVWAPISGFAQLRFSSARSMALGGAYSARAFGAEAAYWNAANLGLLENRGLSVQVISLGANLANSSFGLNDYRKYNGGHLSDVDKREILAKIPAGGAQLFGGSRVNLLGISIQRFAVSSSLYGISNLRISKDFADLVLNGNELGKRYDFAANRGRGMIVGDFAVSYGHGLQLAAVPELAFGATLHFLTGFRYLEVASSQGALLTEPDGIHGEGRAEVRTSKGGRGYALDLGIAAKLNASWFASLAVDHVVGRLTWRKKNERRLYGFTIDSLTVEQAASSDGDSVFNDYEVEELGRVFRSGEPTEWRLGAAFTSGTVRVSLEFSRGLRQTAATTKKPRFAAGLEYSPLAILPIRLGAALGGRSHFLVAYGFGIYLGEVSVNIAGQSQKGIVPGSGNGLGLAMDISIGL